MTKRVIGLGLAVALAAGGMARAQEAGAPPQPFFDAVETAEKAAREGRPLEALDRLDAAIDVLSDSMPLAVRVAEIVTAADAYGQYTERGSNVFSTSDSVKLYVEPAGYTHQRQGDEYSIVLTGDFEMRNARGQVIVAENDFARFAFSGRRASREFYLTIDYAFRNVRPGDYLLVTTLTDAASGKEVAFDMPIVVADVPAAQAPTEPQAPPAAGRGG